MKRAEIKALKKCKNPELQKTAALILLLRSLQFGHKRLFRQRLADVIDLQALPSFPAVDTVEGGKDFILNEIRRRQAALKDQGAAPDEMAQMLDRVCREIQAH